jgi:hypothetical protein
LYGRTEEDRMKSSRFTDYNGKSHLDNAFT